jgi:N-acylneuraminate cytidylyltransferase/CMP-N,N'-diacetyllegionaminic acid synthase
MIKDKSVCAIVPARGGSKGLPRKNIMPLAGKTLIAWTIGQARTSRCVDAVIVSTDDAEIEQEAKRCGARVPFRRPAELAIDTAASIDVILHALDQLEQCGEQFSIVVMLEPTSPLREMSDIDGALLKLVETAGAESIVGVAQVEAIHPAFLLRERNGFLCPYSGVYANNVRRQDIERLLFLEGSVYAGYTDSLRTRRSFYHERTIGWLVPRYKALEIDEMSDLIAAEALLAARREGRL